MIPLEIMDTENTIRLLFVSEARFRSNTMTYGLFRAIDTVSAREREERVFNSNSFTRGLLREIGITSVPGINEYNAPGWDYPVPRASFGH
jgi:hypothetical protein